MAVKLKRLKKLSVLRMAALMMAMVLALGTIHLDAIFAVGYSGSGYAQTDGASDDSTSEDATSKTPSADEPTEELGTSDPSTDTPTDADTDDPTNDGATDDSTEEEPADDATDGSTKEEPTDDATDNPTEEEPTDDELLGSSPPFANEHSITFTFPESLTGDNIFFVEAGDKNICLLYGVTAVDENYTVVEVFIIDDGGFHIHAEFPYNVFTVVYGAAHPITLTTHTSEREVIVFTPIDLPAPALAGITAVIRGEGMTVDFSPGQPQIPFRGRLNSSSQIPQTVEVTATFSSSMTSTRTVEISLENGLGFHSMPGMVATETFAGRANNWEFYAPSLAIPFPGVILDAVYTQNPVIEQTAGANHHSMAGLVAPGTLIYSYQPIAGTLVYTIAPGTTSITIPVNIVSDVAFATQVANGGRHSNPITVTVSETGTPATTATLNRYEFIGGLQLRVDRRPGTTTRVYGEGQVWSSIIDPTIRISSQPAFNLAASVLSDSDLPILMDYMTIVLRVPKAITDESNLTVEIYNEFNSPQLTDQMWFYEINTVENPSSVTHHYVTIILMYTHFRSYFIVQGEIPSGAVPDTYVATAMDTNRGVIIPFGTGSANVALTRDTFGATNVVVAETFQNALRIVQFPTTVRSRWSGIPSASGALQPLGGFNIENPFAEAVYNQAFFIEVPHVTQDYIGVQAFRLPAGGTPEEIQNGIHNIVATTTSGRTIYGEDISPSGIFPINMPATQTASTNAVELSFVPFLNDGEYIQALFFQPYGDVPVNSTWFRSQPYAVLSDMARFVYFGVMHDVVPPDTEVSVHVTVGQYLENGERDNTAIDSTLRTDAYSRMIAHASGQFATNTATSGVNNETIVVGESLQNVSVIFSGNADAAAIPHRVYAQQGFYVYLRSLNNVISIDRTSINATWGDITFSEANGNLIITTLYDNIGNGVYRLTFDTVILGHYGGINDVGRFIEWPSLEVNMDLAVLSTAMSGAIRLADLFMINTISNAVDANLPSVDLNFLGDAAFEQSNSYLTLNSDFYIPGCSRAVIGSILGVPNIINQMLHIVSEQDVLMNAEIRQTVDGIVSNWYRYNWDTGNTIITITPDSEDIEYRLTMVNRSGHVVSDFYALIPIPKYNEVADGGAGLLQRLPHRPFGWSVSVADEVVLPSGFEALYSADYALSAAGATFVTWGNIGTIGGRQNIRMVKIRATAPIPIDAERAFYLPLEIASDADLDAHNGNINVYASMVFRSFPGLSDYRPSPPVGMRLVVPQDPGEITITKTSTPSIATVGSTATYTLTVRNHSSSPARDLLVVDVINQTFLQFNPASLTISGSGASHNFNSNTGELRVYLTEIAPNGTATITFNVTILPAAEGFTVENIAIVYGAPEEDEDGNRRRPERDRDRDRLPVPGAGNPFVIKTSDTSEAEVGDIINYTISVINRGTAPLIDYLVIDALDQNLVQFNPASLTVTGGVITSNFNTATGEIRVYIAELAVNDTITITFSVTVLEAAAGEDIENIAIVYGPPENGGRRLERNRGRNRIPVRANLEITKTSSPSSPAEVGDIVTYTITVENLSRVTVRDLLVVDMIDQSLMEFIPTSLQVSGANATHHFNATTGELRVYISTLASRSTATITFDVEILSAAEGLTIENIAILYGAPEDDSNGNRRRPERDRDRDRLPVNPPNPSITKTANSATAQVGDIINYTITVTNADEDNAVYDFVVVDMIDLHFVQFMSANFTVSAANATHTFSTSTGELRVYLPEIGAGETITITVSVMVLQAALGSNVVNIAVLYGPPTDDGENGGGRPEIDRDRETVGIPDPTIPTQPTQPTEPTSPEDPTTPTPPPTTSTTPTDPTGSTLPGEDPTPSTDDSAPPTTVDPVEPDTPPTNTPQPTDPTPPQTPSEDPDLRERFPDGGGNNPDIPPLPTIPGNDLILSEDGLFWIELDENGVPLGAWHWDEDEGIWIFDPEVPQSAFAPIAAAGMLPQTGLINLGECLPLMVGLTLVIALASLILIKRETMADTKRKEEI